MINSYKTFETKRLFIRPMGEEDAEFFLELVNSPKWIKFIGDRKVQTIKDAEDYIKARMLPQLKRLGFGNNVVIRKEDGVKVGSCGLYDREGLEGIDIGYAMLPRFEKLGFAFESVSNLMRFANEEFSISKLSAITLVENDSSKNLLVKLGFTFDKMVNLPSDDADLMMYSVELEK